MAIRILILNIMTKSLKYIYLLLCFFGSHCMLSCNSSSDESEREVIYFGYGRITDSPIRGTLYGMKNTDDWYIVNEDGAIEVEPYFRHDYNDMSKFKIPKTVKIDGKKYKVTIIGNRAFGDCYKLKSIKIPKSIKKIVEFAFSGCSDLRKVEIPRSTEVSEDAFSGCPNVEISYY